MDWNEKLRPGDEILVVEIAGVNSRWRAGDTAHRLGRRDAHAAEKRMQRNIDLRGKAGDHLLPVERNYFHPGFRELTRSGEDPALRAEAVVSVRNGDVDFLDPHFERIARLGALDEDRAGQDMAARSLVFHFGVDGLELRLHVFGFHAVL